VGYNFIHNPSNLANAVIVIIGVIIFTIVYKKIENRPLKRYLDKDLEEKETSNQL